MGRVRGADAAFTGASGHLRSLYRSGRTIIGVCASGVIIRALAPFLTDTWVEPPVLALAADGSAVVPLLGVPHGANDLADLVAKVLGIRAGVTTAGEVAGGAALDALPDGWRLANPEVLRSGVRALMDGRRVLLDPGDLAEGLYAWLTDGNDRIRVRPAPTGPETPIATFESLIRLSDRADRPWDADTIVLRPPTLAVGVGCRRGCAPGELENLVRESLAHAGVSPLAVACVVSLDVKADEPAVLALGDALEVPVRFLDAAALEAQTPRLATPSERVFREIGCHGVAEAAALAAAGADGVLLGPKRKSLQATCAVARNRGGIQGHRVGRPRGRLWIVDLGPRASGWRTPEAGAALATASHLVGNRSSLDLVGEMGVGRARHVCEPGTDTDPVLTALDLAARGRDVALVTHGGLGVRFLASRLFQVIDTTPERADWRRVDITLCPGVSVPYAVSTRVGTPLGGDICSISLSNATSARAAIEHRLRMAADGDFAIVLNNVLSDASLDLLDWARVVLLRHRAAETPVVVARDVGGTDEAIWVTTLHDLDPAAVGLGTMVLVGSSTTRRVGAWVYTPLSPEATGHGASVSEPVGDDTAPPPDALSDPSAESWKDPVS